MGANDWIIGAKLARLEHIPRKKRQHVASRYVSAVRAFRAALVVAAVLALTSENSSMLDSDGATAAGRLLGSKAPCDSLTCTEKFRSSTSILCLVTILVIFSVSMEKFVLEPLKEDVEENLKPIVNSLFSELTLLGFVGLFMFIVTKLHLMEGMSMRIFGEAEALQELFEAVHMVLFLVMVLFLSSATLLLYYGQQAEKKWRRCNELAVDEKDKIIQRYAVAIQHSMHPSQDVQDEMLFLSLRHRFVHGEKDMEKDDDEEEAKEEGGEKKKKKSGWTDIPHDFELNDYLSIIQGETTGEIIELPVSSWAFLEIAMLFFYFIQCLIPTFAFSIVFVGSAYVLMILNFFMDRKLIAVIRHLTPRIFYKRAEDVVTAHTTELAMGVRSGLGNQTKENYQAVAATLPDEDEALKPRYLKLKQTASDEWGRLRRYLFGRLPNQHEQLFWGGSKGAEVMLFLIRIQLMWSAVYVSVFLVVLLHADMKAFKGQPLGMLVMMVFVVIPVAVNFIQLAHISRNFVIATSVELMKKHHVIRRVRRRMTTKKAVRCLKLIRMMKKNMPKKKKDGDAGPHKQMTALEIYTDKSVYNRKKRELKELFELFDKDHSGNIDTQEMIELLQMLNMADSDDSAADMMKELDNGDDGQVDFDEFFDWMAIQDSEGDEDEDVEDYIDGMFNMIDTDGSDSITAQEFQDCLKNLGTDLSMEDIQAMIREVDENGDGDIDREEFVKMVQKHMEEV